MQNRAVTLARVDVESHMRVIKTYVATPWPLLDALMLSRVDAAAVYATLRHALTRDY